MPARIRITRGVNAGTTHEIHVNFLRVGSDLSCDFCIPSTEVPAFAVLVEYVEASRSYQIHCRSQDVCYFNGRLMNPGDKRDWTTGLELAIGRALGFELELDANPAPAPPETRRDQQQQFVEHQMQESVSLEAASVVPPEKSSTTSFLPQLCVIFVCIAVSILAVLGKMGMLDSLTGSKEDSIPTIQEVLLELDNLDKSDTNKKIYLRLFMEAKREEDRVSAKEHASYSQLRNIIYQDRELSGDTKLCDKTIRYINDRIQRLSVADQ